MAHSGWKHSWRWTPNPTTSFASNISEGFKGVQCNPSEDSPNGEWPQKNSPRLDHRTFDGVPRPTYWKGIFIDQAAVFSLWQAVHWRFLEKIKISWSQIFRLFFVFCCLFQKEKSITIPYADGTLHYGVFLSVFVCYSPELTTWLVLRELSKEGGDPSTLCELYSTTNLVLLPLKNIVRSVSFSHDCISRSCPEFPWFSFSFSFSFFLFPFSFFLFSFSFFLFPFSFFLFPFPLSKNETPIAHQEREILSRIGLPWTQTYSF